MMPPEKGSVPMREGKSTTSKSTWPEWDVSFFRNKLVYGDKPELVKQALTELGCKNDQPLDRIDMKALQLKLLEIGARPVNEQLARSDEQRKFTAY